MKSFGLSDRIALADAIPIIALVGLVAITACSPKSPSPATNPTEARPPSVGQPSALPGRSGLVSAVNPLPQANVHQESPTRSEIRVMEQQVKGTETEIRGLIQDFDANLGDPGMRKKTEQAFRSTLSEYKAKMLVLGKTKLQQAE